MQEAREEKGAAEVAQRPWVAWGVALAVVLAGVALIFVDQRAVAPLRRGDQAPAFELPQLGGGVPLGPLALRGRVVLVNFWASWCSPCRSEMPALDRLYRQLQPEGFALLAVSVDESRADVEVYREQLDLAFPILLDPQDRVSADYQTVGIPESFLLDREGHIVERYTGPRDWERADYVERIRRLMRTDAR